MTGELSVDAQAIKVVTESAYDPYVRMQMGDCATGAFLAGLDKQAATELAVSLHMDPRNHQEIVESGGLFVGAKAAIIQQRVERSNG